METGVWRHTWGRKGVDEGRDALVCKPLLNLRRTLVKNPGIGVDVLGHGLEFFCGIFEVE